jgi:hypothetical protein
MTGVSRSQPITDSNFAADLAKLLAIMKGAQGRSDALMCVWDHDITAVERALARITELEEALQPFSKLEVGVYGVPDEDTPDEAEWFRHDGDVLRVGDFRKARAVLQPKAGS